MGFLKMRATIGVGPIVPDDFHSRSSKPLPKTDVKKTDLQHDGQSHGPGM